MTISLELVPTKFTELPYYRDLVAAIEQLVSDQVWDPIDQLKAVRQPRVTERFYLALTASLLGFSFKADLFDDLAYIRIVEGISAYYSAKGTHEFVSFMGWINNTQFELTPLWTKDYISFLSVPNGLTAYDGSGPWYLTPHVSLSYDADTSPIFADVESLFYYMAPVNLVLSYVAKYNTLSGGTKLLMSGLLKRVFV